MTNPMAGPNDLQHNQQQERETPMSIEEANVAQVQANTAATYADIELKKAHARLMNAQAEQLENGMKSATTE